MLEAIRSLKASPAIFVDKLSLGREKIESLLAKMVFVPSTGCWLWTLSTSKGYGVVKIRRLRKSNLSLHRLFKESVEGPIDEALQLHHQTEVPIKCHGRLCANPDHTKIVTPEEHLVEYTPTSVAAIAAHRDCCAAGHPYTPESLRIGSTGFRECRVCDRIRAQGRRDAKRVRPKHKKNPANFKTECLRGHALIPGNVLFYKTKWGIQKRCRECCHIRQKEMWDRRKAEQQ